MNVMATRKRRFVSIRGELAMTQLELAKEANLSVALISKIELETLPIREVTAWQLFYTINRLRAQRSLPDLDFDEIEWNLSG